MTALRRSGQGTEWRVLWPGPAGQQPRSAGAPPFSGAQSGRDDPPPGARLAGVSRPAGRRPGRAQTQSRPLRRATSGWDYAMSCSG